MELTKIFSKTTLYVVRCNKNNEYQDSTTCNKCSELMISLKIKRIVYSVSNLEFKSCAPCNLDCNHVSAGTKFILKSK